MLINIQTKNTDGTMYTDAQGNKHAYTPLQVVSLLSRDTKSNRVVLSLYNFSAGDSVTVEHSPDGANCWTTCINGADGTPMIVTANRSIPFKQIDGYIRCSTTNANSAVQAVLK